jgi:hypothetical protein
LDVGSEVGGWPRSTGRCRRSGAAASTTSLRSARGRQRADRSANSRADARGARHSASIWKFSRDGAYVSGGRCRYPLRTVEPTGLIEVEPPRRLTLGDFFDLWGQPLEKQRVLGFHAQRRSSVSVFVDGHSWSGNPRLVPLERHRAIVVEVGGYFPPTKKYLFPDGL